MASTRNDDERAQWVDNDEGLYTWRRETRLSMRAFVRQYRAEIDAAIDAALSPPPAKTWRDYAYRAGSV